MSGTLGSCPIIYIMPLEIIEFRADKIKLNKCNARIQCWGGVRGRCVGGGSGGGLKEVNFFEEILDIFKVTNRCIRL